MQNLMTAKEVSKYLMISQVTLPRLGIPFIRIGQGRGVKRYREEDVERYLNQRIEYQRGDVDGESKKGRRILSQKPPTLGLQGLPTRAQIRAIRMGNGSTSSSGTQ